MLIIHFAHNSTTPFYLWSNIRNLRLRLEKVIPSRVSSEKKALKKSSEKKAFIKILKKLWKKNRKKIEKKFEKKIEKNRKKSIFSIFCSNFKLRHMELGTFISSARRLIRVHSFWFWFKHGALVYDVLMTSVCTPCEKVGLWRHYTWGRAPR